MKLESEICAVLRATEKRRYPLLRPELRIVHPQGPNFEVVKKRGVLRNRHRTLRPADLAELSIGRGQIKGGEGEHTSLVWAVRCDGVLPPGKEILASLTRPEDQTD